jgi:MFS family permease
MYIAGIIPALIVAVFGRIIPESDRWIGTKHSLRAIGATLHEYRRNLMISIIVSASITVAFWAISSWVPTYVATLAHDPQSAIYYAGWAGALFAIGEMIGCVAFGWLAEIWGRRWTLVVYLAGSIVITPIIFLLVHDAATFVWLQILNGILTGGIYGWYAIHPSELFPTSIRSSAISIIFNSARFLAMLGPIVASSLIALFGGYGEAATILSSVFAVGIVGVLFLPETKGRVLPA